jgi:outer membrane protein, heavy metal efflux system
MSQRAFVPALVLAAGLSSSSVRAEEAAQADDPVLEGLIAEALERSPELQAARHLLSAAQARPDQAASRPGPMLGVLYTNDGWSPSLGREDMTTLSVMGSQELPFPGKRRLRREVAEAGADVVSQDVERARLSLVSSVKQAYYGLAVARGLASLAGEQRELWKEIQETSRVRYASAAGPQQELLRAQVEATRVQALHAQHHAEARARLAELNRLRGRPPGSEVETPATVRLVTLDEPLEVLPRSIVPRNSARWRAVISSGRRWPSAGTISLSMKRAQPLRVAGRNPGSSSSAKASHTLEKRSASA